MLAKANRERLAVLLNETEAKKPGSERYAAALRCACRVAFPGARPAFTCCHIPLMRCTALAGASLWAPTAEAPPQGLRASGRKWIGKGSRVADFIVQQMLATDRLFPFPESWEYTRE
jgi:hypothetical protein